MPHRSLPVRELLIVAFMLGFVVCVGVAMRVYPGGTWWNAHHLGHDFWQNFLCDLLHNPALNHEGNAMGSRLAKGGMLLFVLGLTLFWSLAGSRLCCHPRLRQVVRVLGVCGTPLVAAVALLPSDQFPRLHTVAVTLGGLPALAALLVFGVALFLEEHCPKWARLLTAWFAILVIVCLLLYVREAVFRAPSFRGLPALERLTTITAVIWVLALLPRQRSTTARV